MELSLVWHAVPLAGRGVVGCGGSGRGGTWRTRAILTNAGHLLCARGCFHDDMLGTRPLMAYVGQTMKYELTAMAGAAWRGVAWRGAGRGDRKRSHWVR